MKNKNKIILSFICTVLIIIGAYFFVFSPQAVKSIFVDGTKVSTIRMYQPMKYPFSIKKEFRNKENKVVEKTDNNQDLYEMTHFEYLKFLVSIEDFQNYIRKLQEKGFLVITAANPSLLQGKACFYELALPLKDENKSILVSLDYNYARKVPTISYVKLPGLVTANDK